MSKELPLISPDKFHDECAVFGIYGHKEAANLTYLGLYALQHRGQEASGMVSNDGEQFHIEKGQGHVADVFSQQALARLPGTMAIGHNRYSTAGGAGLKNVQPLNVNFAFGNLAVAHNGNLINATMLRSELEAYGAIFQSTSDTEVIIHLIAHSRADTLLERVVDSLTQVRGAFSVVLMTDQGVIAARDPHGFRPLCLGRLRDAWIVASESCAFDLLDAEFVREIEPGELVVLDHQGVTSYKPFAPPSRRCACLSMSISPDPTAGFLEGALSTRSARRSGGNWQKNQCGGGHCYSGAGFGCAGGVRLFRGSGIRFETGLIRNHYVGRTFIEPEQSIRHFGVKVKLNAVPEVLEGKRVVVVDDSLVRGTTSRKIVKMLRHAGAKEVHMRISSPPIISPCFYGIDTPTKKELIASSHTTEEIRKYITADSLAYLSLDGMLKRLQAFRSSIAMHALQNATPFPLHAQKSCS